MRFAVLLLALALLSQVAAAAAPGPSPRLVIRLEPLGDGWRTEVSLGGLSCSGVVKPAPVFREARTVAPGLLVTHLYYVLYSACGPRAGVLLDELRGLDRVVVEIDTPSGYVVRTGMDWRGYGPLGGPYSVPGRLLAGFYVFDGLAVLGNGSYVVHDYPGLGFSVAVERGAVVDAGAVAEAAAAARGLAERVMGASPRSPVVAVVLSPAAAGLLVPGTAWSMGGVFVVVLPGRGAEEGWLVHVAAHEALHGWFNDGLLYGDFSLEEAAAEWLAVLALNETGMLGEAMGYVGSLVDTGDPYGEWMLVHAVLWRLSQLLCGPRSPYEEALRSLFEEALNGSARLYSILDLVSRMAGDGCGGRVIEAWARVLPRLPGAGLVDALRLAGEAASVEAMGAASASVPREGLGVVGVEGAACSSSTVTVTPTATVTVTSVSTVSVAGGCSSRGASWQLLAVLGAGMLAARLALRRLGFRR